MSERPDEAHSAPEHDPAISALYRKAGGDLGPPRALDQAVLGQARRAVRRRRRVWMLPLSTAAVVVVGLTLLLKMNDRWDFSRDLVGNSPKSPSVSQPSAKAEKAELPSPAKSQEFEKAPTEADAGPSAAGERAPRLYGAEPESVSSEAPPNPAPAARRLEPKSKRAAPSPSSGGLKTREGTAANNAAPSPDDESAGGSGVLDLADTPLPTESTQDALSKESAFPAEQGIMLEKGSATSEPRAKAGLAREPAPMEEAVGMEEKPRTESEDSSVRGMPAPLEPDAWLQKIRELAAAGEKKAARKELESFKRQYPEYPVPKDLGAL